MKIHIANYEQDRLGGGWSFQSNLAKGISQSTYEDADIYFITSPTICQRKEVEQAFDDGKHIVLRIDNAVRNSRNRNTGMSRMYDFAQMADLVIYQSRWARDYLMPFIKKDGPIIINGVDLDVFKPAKTLGPNYENNYLYTRYNRDETKNWEVARYDFSRLYSHNENVTLHIAGNFSPELVAGNFDFYNGENIVYYGNVNREQMSDVYRICKHFYYTYYNDACSNSLIEALVSGCEIVGDEYYRTTGGAAEILDKFYENGREYFSIERMCKDYAKQLQAIT